MSLFVSLNPICDSDGDVDACPLQMRGQMKDSVHLRVPAIRIAMTIKSHPMPLSVNVGSAVG